MVLDALRELGEGRWVPWEAVAGYVRDDTRTPGVARLLRRWADRAGIEPPLRLLLGNRAFDIVTSAHQRQLGEWRRYLDYRVGSPGITSVDTDEVTNQIRYGVVNAAARRTLERTTKTCRVTMRAPGS